MFEIALLIDKHFLIKKEKKAWMQTIAFGMDKR